MRVSWDRTYDIIRVSFIEDLFFQPLSLQIGEIRRNPGCKTRLEVAPAIRCEIICQWKIPTYLAIEFISDGVRWVFFYEGADSAKYFLRWLLANENWQRWRFSILFFWWVFRVYIFLRFLFDRRIETCSSLTVSWFLAEWGCGLASHWCGCGTCLRGNWYVRLCECEMDRIFVISVGI